MAVSRAPRLADLILFISARAEPARAGSLKAPSITGEGGTGGGRGERDGGMRSRRADTRERHGDDKSGAGDRALETRAELSARSRAPRGDLARCPGGRPYFISPRC